MTQNQQTSLVKTTPAGAIEKWNATPEQVQLLKNTIAKGTSDDEFALFMTVATRQGLDPFLRQIHAVRRWDPESERMVMQIQTGIDGYRLMAERSGVYGGQEGPWWCGEDGQWVDVWLAKVAPAAAKVIVHRTDKPRPFIAIALWAEYAQTKKDGTLTAMWRKRGPGQLAKCAEALAFRRAFPIEIGGATHVDAEMESDFIEADAVEQPKFTAPPAMPAPQAATPTNTGAPANEQPPKRAPGRPPKDKSAERPTTPATGSLPSPSNSGSPSPSASPPPTAGPLVQSAATDGSSSAETNSAGTDRWGQPVADPTSAGGGPAPQSSEASGSEMPSIASTGGPSSDTADETGAADDGFGGEDPADSQPPPTGDPGMKLIEDLKMYLAKCRSQEEMA
ncbi:MAG TPA: phage recombination protein Bet, partial [Candidatus Dormibacteraeota bacterium]